MVTQAEDILGGSCRGKPRTANTLSPVPGSDQLYITDTSILPAPTLYLSFPTRLPAILTADSLPQLLNVSAEVHLLRLSDLDFGSEFVGSLGDSVLLANLIIDNSFQVENLLPL